MDKMFVPTVSIIRRFHCSTSTVNSLFVREMESDSSSTFPSPSLIGRLHLLQKSPLGRKRIMKTNLGKSYKKHTMTSTKNDPKSVSPADRILQYKDGPFTVSVGKLFCLVCLEEVD